MISQAFIFGDGKSYLVALVTLNQPEVEAFAQANGIEFSDFARLTKNEMITQSVKQTIERANDRVSSSEQIKKYEILRRDFQLETCEITPTLKLKRDVIAEKFQDLLAKLYG